jgi:hypothetical protein
LTTSECDIKETSASKKVQASVTSAKSKMGKGGKHLQNATLEIKELQDSLHDLDNLVLNLHKQIDSSKLTGGIN